MDDMPELDFRLVAEYLKMHSIFFHKKYQRGYSEEAFTLSIERLTNAWDTFFFYWNGRLDIEDVYYHHLRVSGKLARDKMQIAIEMAKSANRLLLRVLPPRQEKGKWTKTTC